MCEKGTANYFFTSFMALENNITKIAHYRYALAKGQWKITDIGAEINVNLWFRKTKVKS